LCCHMHFMHAFTAVQCVFKIIMLVDARLVNQCTSNYISICILEALTLVYIYIYIYM